MICWRRFESVYHTFDQLTLFLMHQKTNFNFDLTWAWHNLFHILFSLKIIKIPACSNFHPVLLAHTALMMHIFNTLRKEPTINLFFKVSNVWPDAQQSVWWIRCLARGPVSYTGKQTENYDSFKSMTKSEENNCPLL